MVIGEYMRLIKKKFASILSTNYQYHIIFETENELIDLVKKYILHFKDFAEIDINAYNTSVGKEMNFIKVKKYSEIESVFNYNNYMHLRRITITAYRYNIDHSSKKSRDVISEIYFENYFEYCLLICKKKSAKQVKLINILNCNV